MNESILYKETPEAVFVRAKGHITAALCADLRDRAFSRLDAPPLPRAFYIDLAECEYMDSTFLGLIVGINKKLKKLSGPDLTILRATPTCLELLKSIGVARLVRLDESAVEFPPFMEEVVGEQEATPEFIFDAHENLSELSEENRKKFSILQGILKDQMDKEGDPSQ